MASGCDPCDNQSPKSYTPYTPINTSGCGCNKTDATCVEYTGAQLTCLGTNFTNKNLEVVLQAINAKVCTTMGDWSGFNYNCLADDYTITTPAEFVDAMTLEYCTLKTNFTTFTTSTYPSGIDNLQGQIDDILQPNLTLCTYSGVVSSDGNTTVLTKLANKLCDLNTRLDLTSVVWNNCYTVVTPPTTLPAAFQLLSDQICLAATTGSSAVLPTFNNQGSCLIPQGTADTLVVTINGLKDRICSTPIFNIDSAVWGCVPNPATGTGPNLQAAFGAVLSKVNALSVTNPTFDGTYFITSYNTPGDPCSGTFVTVDPDILGGDRFVASNPADTTPGTLIEKLSAGTGITINDTTPGVVTINSTATDQLVKASSTDPSAGYLDNKVNGINNSTKGISISAVNNGTTNKVDFSPDIDPEVFGLWFMSQVESNPTLYAAWCNLNCGCPDCSGGTTTTTLKPPDATLRMAVINETPDPIDINVILNQNSPTVGFISGGINVLAAGTFNTGYFPLTTPIVTPRTVDLTLSNPAFGIGDYNVQVDVLQGSYGSVIPGSTSASLPSLNSYNNTSFSLGSTAGDIVIRVTISIS